MLIIPIKYKLLCTITVVLLINSVNLHSQSDTISINKATFIFTKQTLMGEYGKKDTILKLYRLDNGKKTYLLKHPLYQYSADCNNEFKDYGSYIIKGDSILFEIKHKQKGTDPIPKLTKQIYRVNQNKKLLLIYSKEYF